MENAALRRNGYQKAFFAVTAFTSLLWLILVFIDYGSVTYIFFRKFEDFLADFTNAVWYSADLDPYRSSYNSASEHGAAGLYYVFFWLFSRFLDRTAEPSHLAWQQPALMCSILLYYIGVGSCIFLSFYEMKSGSKPVKFFTAVFLMFSAIFMFTVERGNIVILGFLMSLFFIMNYDNENKVIREISFITLAAAAGIRIAPAILGAVLLYQKRWKEAARLIIYGLIFFFVPFLIVKPWGITNLTDTLKIFLNNLKLINAAYQFSGCGFGGMFEDVIRESDLYIKIERVISCLVSAVIMAAYPFREKKWMKLLAVTTVMVMLPSHSLRYNLIYFLPVIVLFLDEQEHRKTDIIYFVLFLSILCPFFNRVSVYFMPGGILFIVCFADSLIALINGLARLKKDGSPRNAKVRQKG